LRVSSGGRLLFDVRCEYTVANGDATPDQMVTVVGYAYRILDGPLNELLAYHLHAHGPSTVVHPHLHVSGTWRAGLATRFRTPELDDLHLPTGTTSLTDVVRLLIVEFGVEPRRPDWEAVLQGD
jgi:hypothetical protein